MKFSFSKIYVTILILWIPFYFFWTWVRYALVGDGSVILQYAIESFDIGLLLLIVCSFVMTIKNKFKNPWDYIIFIITTLIFFLSGGYAFFISYF